MRTNGDIRQKALMEKVKRDHSAGRLVRVVCTSYWMDNRNRSGVIIFDFDQHEQILTTGVKRVHVLWISEICALVARQRQCRK